MCEAVTKFFNNVINCFLKLLSWQGSQKSFLFLYLKRVANGRWYEPTDLRPSQLASVRKEGKILLVHNAKVVAVVITLYLCVYFLLSHISRVGEGLKLQSMLAVLGRLTSLRSRGYVRLFNVSDISSFLVERNCSTKVRTYADRS